jgi:hypothetical protein
LFEKRIITKDQIQGKRGVRVYPPWDKVSNKQAEKTQDWQIKYFVIMPKDGSTDLALMKSILGTNTR